MKQLSIIALLFLTIACSPQKDRKAQVDTENLSPEKKDSLIEKIEMEFQQPIVLKGTNQILMPLGTNMGNWKERKSSYKDAYQMNYWNVLFFDRMNGNSKLLTKEKVNISTIRVNQNEEYSERNEVLKDHVLYQMRSLDMNKDGLLNSKDPEYLYSSKLDGQSLMRISPENENLLSYQVVPKSNQIILRSARDSNKDSDFDNNDKSYWYIADLKENAWSIKEIVDKAQEKELQTLFFEQWMEKQGAGQ